jgi:hypothetical protein
MSPDHAPRPDVGPKFSAAKLGYMYYCTLDYEEIKHITRARPSCAGFRKFP